MGAVDPANGNGWATPVPEGNTPVAPVGLWALVMNPVEAHLVFVLLADGMGYGGV